MNYNKQFAKEEFLSLPIYPHSRGVPANTNFLLGEEVEIERDGETVKETAGQMAGQKNALLRLLEEVTTANIADLYTDESLNKILKVKYWRTWKDGNVSERGGHITMKSIIESMRPQEEPKPDVDLSNLVPVSEDVILNV